MASIFYQPIPGNDIYKSGFHYNNSINVSFLNQVITPENFAIVTDIFIQNKDTIQYFLTFDDYISYFHFGRGLGSMTITGLLFSDCKPTGNDDNGTYTGISAFMTMLSTIRGKVQEISFGNTILKGVVSGHSIHASAEGVGHNAMEFTLQIDITDPGLTTPEITPSC